jgi:formiminoglutamase
MKFQNECFEFVPFSSVELSNLTFKRMGEQRLGQEIKTTINPETRFLILGIEESIGILANRGRSGSENAFASFLSYFLNMQSNRFLHGKAICLLGSIKEKDRSSVPENMCEAVNKLDALVFDVLSHYIDSRFVLILIGGGHNNSYPLLKSIYHHFKKPLSVLNLDPHGDCRALEGRHSGNAFSYATVEGYLKTYCVMGLHKAYNNETILEFLDQHKYTYSFYDDILADRRTFHSQLDYFIHILKSEEAVGLELDMDSIAFSPSSAFTPSGISIENARTYIRRCSKELKPIYLHLPEAAPVNEIEQTLSGKLLEYLTYDFIVEQTIQ